MANAARRACRTRAGAADATALLHAACYFGSEPGPAAAAPRPATNRWHDCVILGWLGWCGGAPVLTPAGRLVRDRVVEQGKAP